MKLSVKSDYAARAVLMLARHYGSGVICRIEQIAREQGLPAKYLVQILIELKDQGIVRSVRGKQGGYLLSRPPAEITLGDVLRGIHRDLFDAPALQDPGCPPELKEAWQRVRKAAADAADAVNFQKLLEQGSDKEKMYYI